MACSPTGSCIPATACPRRTSRTCAAVGLPVEELHRRRYGAIADKGLEPGGYRELAGDEVEALRRAGEDVAVAVGGEVEGQPVLLAAEAPPVPEPLRVPEPGQSGEETAAAPGEDGQKTVGESPTPAQDEPEYEPDDAGSVSVSYTHLTLP